VNIFFGIGFVILINGSGSRRQSIADPAKNLMVNGYYYRVGTNFYKTNSRLVSWNLELKILVLAQ
jgi:hypothetical protein